jgi:hypothetical protein
MEFGHIIQSKDFMHQRIFRGCRRSLTMWRAAIGRYRQPQEEEGEEVERVKTRRLKRLGLRLKRLTPRRFVDRS